MNFEYKSIIKNIAFIFCFLAGLFHVLNVSGVLVLSTQIIRIIHLMIMLAVVFLTKGLEEEKKSIFYYIIPGVGVFIAFYTGIYILNRWQGIALSGGVTNTTDAIVGVIMILLTIEATRRSVGKILSIIVAIFLSYPFVGQYLPGILHARTYSWERVSTFLFASEQGIYGIPIGVSATYIVMFCIYGAFLSEFGAGDFLHKFSASITKNLTAASAKTTVVFSTLVGMISGSAAGNVAVSGTFTIPMMKKDGYKDYESGAIAAVASTGGQIMPPVMGAAAFMMAEIIGMPYLEIMKAGLIPALLFFASLFIVVHFDELKHKRITKVERVEKKLTLWETLKEGWFNIVPIMTLVYMLIIGFSPVKAAYFSILILLAIAFFALLIKKELSLYKFLLSIVNALEKGIRSAVPIAIACASAGIITGILSMTGLGSKFSSLIINLSQGIPLLALLLTMVTSIILGMGLPTTAAYLILATVVAPALVRMGVPLLTAHMFVFYFGCVSTITPPVALASYVASGIANADINKVSWTAFKFGLTSFVLPYMFYYGPALLLQGSSLKIITTVIMALIGVFAIAVGIVGYFNINLKITPRVLIFASGILLIYQGLITDIIGISTLVLVYLYIFKFKVQKKI